MSVFSGLIVLAFALKSEHNLAHSIQASAKISDHLSAIRLALARLSKAVASGYSVNLNVSVEVFDKARPHALPLLTAGLTTSEGKPPYKTSGDSSPHRYVVDGDI
jgi:hypothetical protein